MGNARGLAFAFDGTLVVVDAMNLWVFTPPFAGGVLNGGPFKLPPPLEGRVTAVATPDKPYGPNYVYLVDGDDNLHRFQLPAGPLQQVN